MATEPAQQSLASKAPAVAGPTRERLRANLLAVACLVLAGFAVVAPIWPAGDVGPRVGMLLIIAGLIEVAHGFRRRTPAGQRAAWTNGALTLLLGVIAINAPNLAPTALVAFMAGTFALDALHKVGGALRASGAVARTLWLAALGNAAVFILFLVLARISPAWAVAIAGGLRLLGTAWNLVRAPVFAASDAGETVVAELDLPDSAAAQAMAERIEEEEARRSGMSWGVIVGYVATLFAIHLGRMGFDRSALGILSPAVALIGDLAVALLFTYAIYVPARLALRGVTSALHRRAWRALPADGAPATRWQSLVHGWLEHRMRLAVRLRNARYSLTRALNFGLRTGLPVAAVLAAIVPVSGMSWYFDTENWAAGVWDSWAAARTDIWREAMAKSVARDGTPPNKAFAVAPEGVDGDFSFVIIGDPGEGDASQWVLTDRILTVAARESARFVVVSSDVVYPTGAMRDYESNFWLPFKGVTKPVYAIPGNHDWYDGLEAFAATFFDEESARAALLARIEADRKLTATTPRRVEALIAEAKRLREAYRVPTGLQQGPYFQLQTPRFALIAVDTGVLRRIDARQLSWLRDALEAARGKFTLVLLGHPLYAVGEYAGTDRPEFVALHDLLRQYDVNIVMGGDTHDLEYYVERRDGRPPLHHFVNGGGGAYLSLGTALAPADQMALADWAFYPATEPLVAKIEQNNSAIKTPFWWWTRRLNGWPFSAEWLSAAFDYNTAPFFQSFLEVRVEPSAQRVRIIPYGVNGQLRQADMQRSPSLAAGSAAPDMPFEWVFPMPVAGGAKP